jgi:hypothetical protein
MRQYESLKRNEENNPKIRCSPIESTFREEILFFFGRLSMVVTEESDGESPWSSS